MIGGGLSTLQNLQGGFCPSCQKLLGVLCPPCKKHEGCFVHLCQNEQGVFCPGGVLSGYHFQKVLSPSYIILKIQRLDNKHVDLDDVAHHEPHHQNLCCLQIQLFSSLILRELKDPLDYVQQLGSLSLSVIMTANQKPCMCTALHGQL